MALVLSLGPCLLVLEIVVRHYVEVDADGNQHIRGARLLPFRLPVERTRRQAAKLAEGKSPCFRYDPELGWAPRPVTACHGGLYVYDRAGIRSNRRRRNPPRTREPGVLRVGLFGDSFTHGDGVAIEDSWGQLLEDGLRHWGIEARVLNFGVGGYGLDQALLRWRKQGAAFELDVVILGFQSENVLRDTNMIRALYWWRTQLPFTKPRFVLEGDELVVRNQPAVSPDELPALLESLPSWPLVEHEGFYDPDDFEPRWWQASRVLGYLAGWRAHEVGTLENPAQERYYVPGSPSYELTLRLLDQLEREVEDAGAELLVVHLPKAIDWQRRAEGRPLWYAALRDEIARRHQWVETEPGFDAAVERDPGVVLFDSGGHYTFEGNVAIADVLRELLRDRARRAAEPADRP